MISRVSSSSRNDKHFAKFHFVDALLEPLESLVDMQTVEIDHIFAFMSRILSLENGVCCPLVFFSRLSGQVICAASIVGRGRPLFFAMRLFRFLTQIS